MSVSATRVAIAVVAPAEQPQAPPAVLVVPQHSALSVGSQQVSWTLAEQQELVGVVSSAMR
jgi:hypothetical protein